MYTSLGHLSRTRAPASTPSAWTMASPARDCTKTRRCVGLAMRAIACGRGWGRQDECQDTEGACNSLEGADPDWSACRNAANVMCWGIDGALALSSSSLPSPLCGVSSTLRHAVDLLEGGDLGLVRTWKI